MNIFKCAAVYVIRKPVKNIILCTILTLLFLGELVGMCVYSIAKNGEQDAFIYNGSSLFVNGKNLTSEIYDKITSIDHVIGVNNWKENVAIPVGLNNVKEHTGVNPGIASEILGHRPNSVVLLALMNTKLYPWFRREKSVSLVSGTFPTYENKGILVESRFAEENNLNLGDSVTFNIQESGKDCTFKLCGIFRVDSDFEITEHNKYGEGVFIYSPYNVIFLDYTYASEVIGFESLAKYGFELYVDRYANVEGVASALHNLLGNDADIQNNSNYYLSNERSIVVLMKNYSLAILGYVSVVGGIVMLLILSFFASQYKREIGIFLALGCKKSRIVLQFFLSMLILIVISFTLSYIVYSFTAEKIVRGIDMTAEKVISQSYKDNSYGPYITPQLGQKFKMQIDVNMMVSLSNYIKIFMIAIGLLILSMLIPIYSIITTKPKFLLSNN